MKDLKRRRSLAAGIHYQGYEASSGLGYWVIAGVAFLSVPEDASTQIWGH